MSIEAVAWALNDAPTTSTTDTLVLVGLANHADPDGRHAFPSVDRLASYARLTRRGVQLALRRLEGERIIEPGDQRVAAAYIGRGDRRPTVYDLSLELRRAQPVDNPGDGVHGVRPVRPTGRTSRRHGANVATSRGEPRSPEPSLTVIQPRDARASSSTGQGPGQGPRPPQPPSRPAVSAYDPTEAEERFAELTGEAGG